VNFDLYWLGVNNDTATFTGDFIEKTGPSRESDFFYMAIQYTF
jgi:hypothetical protein